MKNLRFIQYGFGPIGQKVVDYALNRGFELAGVIDSDPEKVGKDAGEFLDKKLNVIIQDNPDNVLNNSKSDLVFLTTGSSLEDVFPQIMDCIYHKKNVISTCEELSFPWKQKPSLSRIIDDIAKSSKVSVIGTGVNPGFAMDALPSFLTSICENVQSVRVERYQDASTRRLPFQKKIGAGCSKKEFDYLVAAKKIRHVGFTESIQMIAHALGWNLDKTEETIKPVIANKVIKGKYLTVKKGDACGMEQVCKGYIQGKEVITLDLRAYLGHKKPYDAVIIEGTPNITSVVQGGINGDIATCAMTVNCAKRIREAKPGLRTMLDIGLTSWYQL